MANINATLTIEILTPWHLGSGREGGAYADSLVNKDNQGLPVVNGKSIKGLLRAACKESLAHQWIDGLTADAESNLFGKEGTDLLSQGVLEVSNATLSVGEQFYFREHPKAIQYLYRVDYNTAIDHDRGTAKDSSLRSTESVVPMTLTASLCLNSVVAEDNNLFFDWLTVSLPLITAVGGKRRRGYGEAVFSLKKENN